MQGLTTTQKTSLAFIESLTSIKELDSPNRSFFGHSDQYSRPPSFLFRFKDPVQKDYDFLIDIIHQFVGNLKWSIQKINDSTKGNYFIEPDEIALIREVNVPEQRKGDKEIMEIIGDRLHDICDLAIDDINDLSTLIKNKHNK